MMRNKILIFAIFILLVSVLFKSSSASMTSTVDDGGDDGYVKGCNCGLPIGEGTYDEAHDTAFSYTQSPLDLYVGQMYDNKEYFVWRSYLSFNTSNIPTASITSVILRLYGEPLGGLSNIDFTIYVRRWIVGNSKPVNSDYHGYSSEDLGTLDTALYKSEGNNDIPLAPSTITTENVTKLCLISSRDLSTIAPTGNEYVMFTTAIKPVLIITYSEQIGFTGPQFLEVAIFASAIAALAYRRLRYAKA